MEQKKRLVELLLKCDKESEVLDCFNERPKKTQSAELIADYLMSNNVVALPCKAGDIIYIIGEITSQIVYDTIHHIMYNGKEFCLVTESGVLVLVEQQLGKTVFLTKPEAEAKWREMQK